MFIGPAEFYPADCYSGKLLLLNKLNGKLLILEPTKHSHTENKHASRHTTSLIITRSTTVPSWTFSCVLQIVLIPLVQVCKFKYQVGKMWLRCVRWWDWVRMLGKAPNNQDDYTHRFSIGDRATEYQTRARKVHHRWYMYRLWWSRFSGWWTWSWASGVDPEAFGIHGVSSTDTSVLARPASHDSAGDSFFNCCDANVEGGGQQKS